MIQIGDVKLSGAWRDSVNVSPGNPVTIAFDANNPGNWLIHCDVVWHLAAGMITTLEYV